MRFIEEDSDALGDLVPFVQFKKRKKGVLLLVKLQALAGLNFTKSNTPPWVVFTFFKLHKWYQVAQNITYIDSKLMLSIYLSLQHFIISNKHTQSSLQ